MDSVFSPGIPSGGPLNRLKDLAQEVVRESFALEGRVAPPTAAALGEKLRLLNSYHSGLIEGHKTTIPDIEKALNQEFSGDEEQCYARELGAAHVAPPGHLDVIDGRAVGLKNTLYTFTMGDLAHGERGVQTTISLGDHHPFEGLQTLTFPLFDLHLYHHGITGAKIRNLAVHLLGFELCAFELE